MKLDPLYRWERRIAALPMPSPLVWSALIAAFLGFGVLMGKATGGSGAKRGPVMLVAATSPAQQAPSGGSTPPPAKSEETPEASSESKGSSKAESSSSSGSSSSSTQSSSEQPSEQKKEASGGGKPSAKLPAIKHVFVLMLSDQPYATAFGPASEAHYLTGTLEKQGTMLERYYSVAQQGLAGAIGMLSGQGPTEATAANCPTYAELAATGSEKGQVLGQGCVYPSSTESLPTQLTAKHLTWRAYVEGQQEGATQACAHPTLGGADPSASASAGYQTWRNPFVYFQGITSSAACTANDVGMSALKGNLTSESKTASFSYIAPGPCVDGSPTVCAPGKATGMVGADGFLKTVVPEILSSPAYKKNGLLAITVDAAPSSGEWADSSSCCGQPRFPNIASSSSALSAAGGGQVGMLLLSPFIKKGGTLVQSTYNHFSLLATVEQLFGLSKLGYAGLSEVKALSPSLFSGG